VLPADTLWPDTAALRITRWYDATPDEVFRAFTDPDLLRQWWGPRGFIFEQLDFPAAEGRPYSVRLRSPDGTSFAHEGVFLQVDAPRALAYSWRWTEGPLDRAETLVQLTFVPERQGVTVSLCHSRFANQDECDKHVGWVQSFDQLGVLLEGPAG
jgi:uncharacterized protein YndB with AHSA1/START domain